MRTAVFLCAALLAAACMRETSDVSQNQPSQSSTTTDPSPQQTSTLNPSTPTEADEPSSRASAASPVQEVHLIEYAVHMPQTMQAGKVSFRVENGGKEQHAFEIEGNGVHQSTQLLSGGSTASLDVDLKPGTYTVYCPVKGHKEKGMKTTVTVQ